MKNKKIILVNVILLLLVIYVQCMQQPSKDFSQKPIRKEKKTAVDNVNDILKSNDNNKQSNKQIRKKGRSEPSQSTSTTSKKKRSPRTADKSGSNQKKKRSSSKSSSHQKDQKKKSQKKSPPKEKLSGSNQKKSPPKEKLSVEMQKCIQEEEILKTKQRIQRENPLNLSNDDLLKPFKRFQVKELMEIAKRFSRLDLEKWPKNVSKPQTWVLFRSILTIGIYCKSIGRTINYHGSWSPSGIFYALFEAIFAIEDEKSLAAFRDELDAYRGKLRSESIETIKKRHKQQHIDGTRILNVKKLYACQLVPYKKDIALDKPSPFWKENGGAQRPFNGFMPAVTYKGFKLNTLYDIPHFEREFGRQVGRYWMKHIVKLLSNHHWDPVTHGDLLYAVTNIYKWLRFAFKSDKYLFFGQENKWTSFLCQFDGFAQHVLLSKELTPNDMDTYKKFHDSLVIRAQKEFQKERKKNKGYIQPKLKTSARPGV